MDREEMEKLVDAITDNDEELIDTIYDRIKQQAMAEINYSDLSIAKALHDIRTERIKKEKFGLILEEMILDPFQPLSSISKKLDVSKQAICKYLNSRSSRYPWLRNLLTIRRVFERGDGNNRCGINGRQRGLRYCDGGEKT